MGGIALDGGGLFEAHAPYGVMELFGKPEVREIHTVPFPGRSY